MVTQSILFGLELLHRVKPISLRTFEARILFDHWILFHSEEGPEPFSWLRSYWLAFISLSPINASGCSQLRFSRKPFYESGASWHFSERFSQAPMISELFHETPMSIPDCKNLQCHWNLCKMLLQCQKLRKKSPWEVEPSPAGSI